MRPSVVDGAFVLSRTRGPFPYGNRNLYLPHRRRGHPLLRRQRGHLRAGDLDGRADPDDLWDPRADHLAVRDARRARDDGAHRRPRPHAVLAAYKPFGWRTA